MPRKKPKSVSFRNSPNMTGTCTTKKMKYTRSSLRFKIGLLFVTPPLVLRFTSNAVFEARSFLSDVVLVSAAVPAPSSRFLPALLAAADVVLGMTGVCNVS